MAEAAALRAELAKLEGQLRRHGFWKKPAYPPPQITIPEGWDATTKAAAEVLNQVFEIRMMPMCCKMFGRVPDSAVMAFNHDYTTPLERLDYARAQLNRLIADAGMLPRVDRAAFSRVEG
ncbi:MAG: hypothetical protein HUU16_06655 [Candidatus Omnitrophica bacterium]|nr:hypothetical protein [bacterium]NUN95835.1 hypothetical protein [Candidatus Omnitrophota bacterium]